MSSRTRGPAMGSTYHTDRAECYATRFCGLVQCLMWRDGLLSDIQDGAQHLISSLYGLDIGLNPPLTDDLVDGFLSEIDVRQFQLNGAIACVVQDRRAGRLILLNHRADATGFHCAQLPSRLLKPIGSDVGHVVGGDGDLCRKSGEPGEGGLNGTDHQAPPGDESSDFDSDG